MNNILIDIEGPEYAGKTTVIETAKKQFPEFEIGKAPGLSYLGELLRPIVKQYKMEPITAIGVMLAHMSDTYKYLIDSNKSWIMDRGMISTLIYQGYIGNCLEKEKHLFIEAYKSIINKITSNFDYYQIVLSINADTVMKRKKSRCSEDDTKDLYDNMSKQKHHELCDYYENIHDINNSEITFLNPFNIITIDANELSKEETSNKVIEIINHLKSIKNK